MNKEKNIIEIDGLRKTYGNNPPLITDFNLRVVKGKMIVILGRSGCGKTTLLNLIGGLDRPDSGRIVIDGACITDMSEDELAKFRLLTIGFVFQDYNLISDLTIIENVALPLKLARKKSMDEAVRLLDIFDIGKLAAQKANTVSGGEAQRAAIARAMANKPKVLLADEPTGNLDEENEKAVMRYFKKVQKEFDVTILIATHNSGLVDYSDEVLQF